MCSSIYGMVSMSSSILPRMVLSPIFNNGFGKFFVNSPSLVAYPAAITTHFILLYLSLLTQGNLTNYIKLFKTT